MVDRQLVLWQLEGYLLIRELSHVCELAPCEAVCASGLPQELARLHQFLLVQESLTVFARGPGGQERETSGLESELGQLRQRWAGSASGPEVLEGRRKCLLCPRWRAFWSWAGGSGSAGGLDTKSNTVVNEINK
jgi:hypothetical protein